VYLVRSLAFSSAVGLLSNIAHTGYFKEQSQNKLKAVAQQILDLSGELVNPTDKWDVLRVLARVCHLTFFSEDPVRALATFRLVMKRLGGGREAVQYVTVLTALLNPHNKQGSEIQLSPSFLTMAGPPLLKLIERIPTVVPKNEGALTHALVLLAYLERENFFATDAVERSELLIITRFLVMWVGTRLEKFSSP